MVMSNVLFLCECDLDVKFPPLRYLLLTHKLFALLSITIFLCCCLLHKQGVRRQARLNSKKEVIRCRGCRRLHPVYKHSFKVDFWTPAYIILHKRGVRRRARSNSRKEVIRCCGCQRADIPVNMSTTQ
jgi:hypothetical protein